MPFLYSYNLISISNSQIHQSLNITLKNKTSYDLKSIIEQQETVRAHGRDRTHTSLLIFTLRTFFQNAATWLIKGYLYIDYIDTNEKMVGNTRS
jgi:hypothetical protein